MSFKMPSIIISSHIAKKYKIGQPKKLTEFLPSFFSDTKQKEFWALKDVNLEIKQGERVGIIGPNGSGKSTFLKILAGVTSPSKGNIIINGKIAALLEVGTGFHPDLTGNENIYFYGAVQGMTPKEINSRYKEIVDFSGIKKFLETPVKYYSSGMFMRLGFSVAVHLSWDILLLDEILSVGDAQFQEKSMKKIESMMNSGKTVILVSHNLESIRRLCTRAVFFKNGKIKVIGKTSSVIDQYLRQQNES